MNLRLGLAILAVCLTGLVLLPASATASQTLTVCASGCGYTSIQAAIQAAPKSANTTITIGAGTYNENVNTLGKNLSLVGAGEGQTVIQAPPTGGTVVTIPSGTVTIGDMLLEDGNAEDGGGMNNAGTLTVRSSSIVSNTAFEGGGIYNTGTLTMINGAQAIAMGRNNAKDDGGGIFNTGTLSLGGGRLIADIGSNIAGNHGGGIFNFKGVLTVTNSDLLLNTAADGGGISNDYGGIASLNGVMITNNTAMLSNGTGLLSTGAGISNEVGGQLTLTNSVVTQNTGATGGGIWNDGYPPVTLINSTVCGNSPNDIVGPFVSNQKSIIGGC
jgi:hypothetical protein